MNLPSNFGQWNRAMRGAYLKGRLAHDAGEPIDACPYVDRRNPSGRLSWSRAFIRAWEDGWWDAQRDAGGAGHANAQDSASQL